LTRVVAAACALAALVSNLLVERVAMAASGSFVIIPGLADIHPAWNRCVSFSLFCQNSDTGQHLLMALLVIIIAVVTVLAWRATNRLAAAGFGLIIGGALGNLIDRVFHGAVFDYLALHLGSVQLFVCNFSDIAISAGVLCLIGEALLAPRPRYS
jgi:signal peptidase II